MSIDPRKRLAPPIRALGQRVLRMAWFLGVSIPLLQGCAAMVVGGVAAGASVAHERRDPSVVMQDEQAELSALKLFLENPEINQHSRISITSYNHVTLLTGQADSDEIADRFAQQVARLPNVKKVMNEVTIGPSASLSRESEDALITSRVKIALMQIDLPGFDATRVKVVTEQGTVFLMGLVHPREADEAAEKARYVPGVTKVVKLFDYIET